jgi:hypothetical protein
MIRAMSGSRIVIDGATYLVVRRRDLCSVEDEAARREIVVACLEDLAGRSAARRLVEDLTGGIMLGASDIARELDRLLESGRVVAVRERGAVRLLDAPRAYDPAWSRGDPRDPGEPAKPGDPRRPVVPPPSRPDLPHGPEEPVVDTTWIEVRLVDDTGTPVAGERVAVRFPDGGETQGYLDGDGRWRLDGIPAGTYQVCFPDAEEPTMPRGRVPTRPTGDAHWIAVRVVGEHGESYADTPYTLTPPDGRVLEGRLDHASTLRIEEITSGACELVLGQSPPNADDGQWSPRLAPRSERPPTGDRPTASAGALTLDPAAPRSLALATDEEHVLIVSAPVLHRLVPGCLAYRAKSVLLLPAPWRAFDPWDVVVALCGWLRERPDHGAVLVGHHADDEDPRHGELRPKALLHFFEGDADAWVAIAAKDGRVSDTQGFLQYLAARHGWPTALSAATDVADEATEGAVEAFQREYNRRFDRSILEDGVIGTQTLGAIFEVASDDLERHLALGGESRSTLRWFDDDVRILAGSRDLASHFSAAGGRALDVVLVPLAADIDVRAEPPAIDVYERARRIDDVAIATVDIADAGTLILDIDLVGLDPGEHPHVLHLRSTDGVTHRSYQLTPGDAQIAHVRFEGLAPAAAYTLALSCEGIPGELVLFEGVPFDEIHEVPLTVASPYPESGEVHHTDDDPDSEEAGRV